VVIQDLNINTEDVFPEVTLLYRVLYNIHTHERFCVHIIKIVNMNKCFYKKKISLSSVKIVCRLS